MKKSNLRIILIGTVEFSKLALLELIRLNANVVGVITKSSSNFNSDHADLVPICINNAIPYKLVTNINDTENLEWIKSIGPTVIFCFGWSSLLKKDLLKIPEMGVIGYHPAYLPKNRGRHPIIWALVLGLTTTASTFFFMDEGADSGDILSQEQVDIVYDDNARSLYTKLCSVAIKQIAIFLPQLELNSYPRIIQDNALANYWRKRNFLDGKIDFRMSSNTIYNLVRALTHPYPGASIDYKGNAIVVWKLKEVDYKENNIEHGKVLDISNNQILIKTPDSAVLVVEHEFKEMPTIGEYL